MTKDGLSVRITARVNIEIQARYDAEASICVRPSWECLVQTQVISPTNEPQRSRTIQNLVSYPYPAELQ